MNKFKKPEPKHNFSGPRPTCIQCQLRESDRLTDGLCPYCRNKAYTKNKQKKETTIRKSICDYLNSLPYSYFHISKPGSRSGQVDIPGVISGRSVHIETKTKQGRLSSIQEQEHKRLLMAGAVVIVARSVEEVKEELKKHGLGYARY